VELQPKVHEALELFLSRPGELVGKEELLGALWPNTYVGEEVLTQVIHKLRHALDDDARAPRILQTVLRRGYRFLPEIVVVDGAPSAEISAAPVPVAVPAAPAPPPVHAVTALSPAPPAATVDAPPAPPPAAPPVAPVTISAAPTAAAPRRRLVSGLALGALALAALAAALLLLYPPRPHSLVPGKLTRVRLTATPEREQEAVFSPEGRTYAYAAYDARSGTYDLYTAALAGSAPVRLTSGPDDDTYPQFSPDGTSISFNRRRPGERTAIWSVASLGGNARLLVADAAWATWSPDGREIAFVRHKEEGGIVSLRRRDLESGAEREVARVRGPISSLRWAARGDQLAFTDERVLWVVPAGGGHPRQVGPQAEYVRSLAWEPSGEALICDASWGGGGTNDLWRVRLAGGAPEPLMAGRGGTYHPDVSPRGDSLLYVDEHKVRQLWVVRADGGEPRPLHAPTTVECVAWSPDHSRVAFDDWEPRPGEGSLALFEMGGDERQLGWGICPTFSPDGRALAFLGGVDRGLWTLDLASGQRRRALADAGTAGFVEANHRRRAAWSPDAARLAYPTRGRDVDGLAVVERATGRERLLLPGDFSGAAWSPDGRWIAAPGVAHEGSGVYVVAAEGGRGRRLSAARPYNSAPIWAADSGSVYVLVDETRRPRLRRIGLAGAELGEIELARPDDPSFWGIFDVTGDPERGWLYLLERYEGDIFLLGPPSISRR
jgi:Tol biopolymer transport system component/DNA-binding winged helix-turn-helix (wHTH) protein